MGEKGPLSQKTDVKVSTLHRHPLHKAMKDPDAEAIKRSRSELRHYFHLPKWLGIKVGRPFSQYFSDWRG